MEIKGFVLNEKERKFLQMLDTYITGMADAVDQRLPEIPIAEMLISSHAVLMDAMGLLLASLNAATDTMVSAQVQRVRAQLLLTPLEADKVRYRIIKGMVDTRLRLIDELVDSLRAKKAVLDTALGAVRSVMSTKRMLDRNNTGASLSDRNRFSEGYDE